MIRDTLLPLVEFNAHANGLMLETAAKLSESDLRRDCCPSHGSVFGLLQHMVGGERAFLDFCQGREFNLDAVIALESLDALREFWQALDVETVAYVGETSDEILALDTTVSFGEMSWVLPAWQLIMQSVTHSMHHRGELSLLFGQEFGQQPPTIDMMLYLIARSGQPLPPGMG